MIGSTGRYRVFLSAAEPSADAHCGALISALKKGGCEIEFVGFGGEKMRAAGCELLEQTTTKAAMIYNAFAQIWYYHRLIGRARSYLRGGEVAVVIVCDSPSFNFHIAKVAKRFGIQTLFYVAPQLWAWAPWRIRKLKKYCDKLCCILPFEQQWFGDRGIDATFVGNPLLDELDADLNRCKRFYLGFDPVRAKIALMPGSRAAEIESLWVPMQQIAVRLKKRFADVTFTTVAIDAEREAILRSMQIGGFECDYGVGSVYQSARESDFSLVASGSATLQVAAAGCPMVIMYQSSRLLWHLVGRHLVTSKYLSLVNILAQKELVPEFMPYFSSIEPVAESIGSFLSDKEKLVQTSSELVELVKPLGQKKASEQVAKIVLDMLGET